MFKREHSVSDISLHDVNVSGNPFQTDLEGQFQNVPPTYATLGPRSNRSDSINSSVYSQLPLVGVKSIRPKLKKICMITFLILNILTIMSLIVALAIVSNRNDTGNTSECQNGQQTTVSPHTMPRGETSTEMKSTRADDTETTTLTTLDTSPATTSNQNTGTWLTWDTWTECSSSCGNGIYNRYRECSISDKIGNNCQGNYVEKEICVQSNCAVYGKWTTWSSWTSCDVTCNGGTQTRVRTCSKTDSVDIDCIGDTSEQKPCSVWDCPDCAKVCTEGVLNPTCDMCVCNMTRQGTVITSSNETISNAAIHINGILATAIAHSDAYGTFTTDIVCDGALLGVEKDGYTSQNCHISAAGVVCTILKNEIPLFKEHPQPKARITGENVTLCCSAESKPEIRYYEWMRGSVLLDNSLYPDGTILEVTGLTKSDSGMYRCRAISDAGSMMSETAYLSIKDSVKDFCEDALGQKQTHLPDDCVQQASMTASVETGYCYKKLCGKEGLQASSVCRDESQNCCTVSDFEVNTIQCTGYNLSVLNVKACGCGDCNYNEVRIVGTVLFYGTNEYVQFGIVYLNGEYKTFTSSKGSFKLTLTKGLGEAIITVIKDKQKTTKVVDVSEGTTGTIYINVYIAKETCSLQINSNVENVVDIGICQNGNEAAISSAELHIPEFSFIDDSFDIFNGVVNVGITFLNVANISELDILPGLLLSINDEGEKIHITTVAAFRLQFYNSITSSLLKLGQNVNIYPSDSLPEGDLSVYGLNQASGIWHLFSSEFPAQLSEIDLQSWISFGKSVDNSKECFFNIRTYEDSNFVSEITNRKYQLFIQTVHNDGSHFYETYGHTFDPSITCFKTICDDNLGFLEVWISDYEQESEEYLSPADPVESDVMGLTDEQKQNIAYSIEIDKVHLNVKYVIGSNGPFFESYFACLSLTQTANHFKFYFAGTVEDVFTLRHFFDLSAQNESVLHSISQKVWYPKRQEGHRVCFVKVKFDIQTDDEINVRVVSYGGTNKNISNAILGIRQSDTTLLSTVCLEYKCSGTINEEFSENQFDDTKVTVEYQSSGSAQCSIQSFSQDLIDEFSNVNPQNAGENAFTFYAPTVYSPSLGIYSASTSSDDIETARGTAKKECRSGIPMDLISDNPDIGTAVVFTCI